MELEAAAMARPWVSGLLLRILTDFPLFFRFGYFSAMGALGKVASEAVGYPRSLWRDATMPKLDDYLHINNAAKYLGVCQNTLRNWEMAGKIPVRRHPVNNYRLFKRSDLDKLLKMAERPMPKPRRVPR